MKKFAFLAMFAASSALAHHGWSEYDAGRPMQLAGIVEQSSYAQPHGTLRLKTAERTWLVVLAPPTRMDSRGLTPEMVKSGAQVSVYGYPRCDNTAELRAERITTGDKTTELR